MAKQKRSATTMTGPMLTTKQLADRWQMDDGTLRNWRSDKKGPQFITLGKGKRPRVLYRLADIEAYETKHQKGGA